MTFRIGKTVSSFALGLALATTALTPVAWAAGASDTDQERTARWQEIAKSIFGDRQIAPTDSLVKIDAPARALDAALVPITLTMPKDGQIKAVSLIIDDNPAPYAARFEFGPAADPAELKLRVRVNNYTDMHAVVETQDGKLYEGQAVREGVGRLLGPDGHERRGGHEGHGRHAHEVRRRPAWQTRGGDADGPPPEFFGHADEPSDPRFYARALHRQADGLGRRPDDLHPDGRHLNLLESGDQLRRSSRTGSRSRWRPPTTWAVAGGTASTRRAQRTERCGLCG